MPCVCVCVLALSPVSCRTPTSTQAVGEENGGGGGAAALGEEEVLDALAGTVGDEEAEAEEVGGGDPEVRCVLHRDSRSRAHARGHCTLAVPHPRPAPATRQPAPRSPHMPHAAQSPHAEPARSFMAPALRAAPGLRLALHLLCSLSFSCTPARFAFQLPHALPLLPASPLRDCDCLALRLPAIVIAITSPLQAAAAPAISKLPFALIRYSPAPFPALNLLATCSCSPLQAAAEAVAAAAADMKSQLDELIKGRADRFDEMFVDEERIRLGEEGWKDR